MVKKKENSKNKRGKERKSNSKDKKEIVIQDPKQNIENVIRYRGVWEGSWFRENKTLAKIALITNFLVIVLMIASMYEYSKIALYLVNIIGGIMILSAVILDIYIVYLIFFKKEDKRKLNKKEKEAINKTVKKIEGKNK